MVRGFPLQFIAGLVDSDGYVGKRYVGIIQNRFRFLVRVKKFASETLLLRFRGPYINRKRNGKIAGWMISIYKKEERVGLDRAINSLKIGQRKADKWLKQQYGGFDVGP